jgi:DegV family protein with EDD domain
MTRGGKGGKIPDWHSGNRVFDREVCESEGQSVSMSVKVVTDSAADIPPGILKDLDITVVPIYVVFGDKTYRDRVDIGEEEFYSKLCQDSIHPTTSVPSPKDFADVYSRLAKETNEIISVHLTSKESGTYNAAMLAKDMIGSQCRIEVVDSLSVSMGSGMLAMVAASRAKAGDKMEDIVAMVRRSVPLTRILIMVDTLKYVVKGGRIGRPQGVLGNALGVRPLLTMKEGDLKLTGLVRTRAKGIERLFSFAQNPPRLREAAVSYTTDQKDAEALADRLRSAFPDAPIHVARVGPALGTHAGPGAMGITVRAEPA